MPLRAIEDQAITPPLADVVRVVVIPSADDRRDGKVVEGTWAEIGDFRRLVAHLRGNFRIEVEVLKEHQHGVPFENMEALSKAVNAAKALIRAKAPARVGRRPVVIDITGGMKPCAAVGATLSFARHECIQYVSTTDKERVTIYDLAYAPNPNPVGHHG